MIRLHETREAIVDLVRTGLAEFEQAHPEIRWAFFGVDLAFVFGSIALNFDTAAGNAASAAKSGSASFLAKGADVLGRYHNNCNDFRFPMWRELTVPTWKTHCLDGNSDVLRIELAPGVLRNLGSARGHQSINEAVFPYFLELLRGQTQYIAKASRNRDQNARLGLQICDSDCVAFWTI